MSKVHVKSGDTVAVISGKDRGARGKVMAVSPSEGKVIVEKVNVVKKHVKPRKMGEQGGIIEAEAALYACKVQLVCPSAADLQELVTLLKTARRCAFAKKQTAALSLNKGGT